MDSGSVSARTIYSVDRATRLPGVNSALRSTRRRFDRIYKHQYAMGRLKRRIVSRPIPVDTALPMATWGMPSAKE